MLTKFISSGVPLHTGTHKGYPYIGSGHSGVPSGKPGPLRALHVLNALAKKVVFGQDRY